MGQCGERAEQGGALARACRDEAPAWGQLRNTPLSRGFLVRAPADRVPARGQLREPVPLRAQRVRAAAVPRPRRRLRLCRRPGVPGGVFIMTCCCCRERRCLARAGPPPPPPQVHRLARLHLPSWRLREEHTCCFKESGRWESQRSYCARAMWRSTALHQCGGHPHRDEGLRLHTSCCARGRFQGRACRMELPVLQARMLCATRRCWSAPTCGVKCAEGRSPLSCGVGGTLLGCSGRV